MNNLFKGHIVDVVNHEIYDGEFVIENGRITSLRRVKLPENKEFSYFMPGFIDSHVHIESSMMTPREFARVAVTHGSIGAIADPHEIANVMGVDGIDFMIRSSEKVLFNFCFGAPSCVPSCGGDIETNGAVIDAKTTEQLMARDDIGFLAEMMNYVGVLGGDPEVLAKIEAARRHGKPVDGHAPGLTGEQRLQYARAGISTDHECSTIEEGRSCVAANMSVIIREGSAAKDYKKLSPLIGESPESVLFCTDDCHPDDLVRGHINLTVKRAMQDGYDLWDILQAACVNPQKHYGLRWGLLQEGDPATFIIVKNFGPNFRVTNTIIRGREAFSYNTSIGSRRDMTKAFDEVIITGENYPNNFVASPITEEDIRLDIQKGDTAHIILASEGSLLTGHDIVQIAGDPLKDARYPWHDVQKIVVYNRYEQGAKPRVGLIRGFGITHGAIASTIAHDCHNIVAIGSSDEYIVKAINRIVEMKGGLVAIADNEMRDLPLPIAGLISPLDGFEVAYGNRLICDMAEDAGCVLKAPFITMGFMCLPVIPELKLTDKHLWDSSAMQVIRS